MKKIRSVYRVLTASKLIVFLFFFSLAFFIYQHSSGFSWDFSTYVLNAKFLVNESHYFEWARPHLPSVMLLPFSIFGWFLAEYAYIIIVSLLHLYSSLKFSERFRIDKTAFYIFSMNVFILAFGFKMGTELLSLALTQLFLAHLYAKRSGVFYALSVLARYTGINLIVLLLFQRKKTLLFSLVLAALVLLPWLIFSYVQTGNPLISFLDSYALNYNFRIRENVSSPFLLDDILFAFNLTLPLFLFGMLSRRNRNYYVILLVLALSVLSYATIPLKEARYLFPLVIPAAYFSAIAIRKLKFRNFIIYSFIFLTAISLILLPATIREQENPNLYKFVGGKNISCMAKSNVWVALNYYGMPSEPHPEKTQITDSLNNGYVVVLFKNPQYPAYARSESFLKQFPIAEETNGYIILAGENCKQKDKFELVFIDRVADYYKTLGENITKCEIVFSENICSLLNGV